MGIHASEKWSWAARREPFSSLWKSLSWCRI